MDKSEVFRTGLKQLHPAWKVEGQWPKDEDSGACLVGRRLADRLGVRLGQPLTIESMAPLSTAANARLKSLRQNPVLPAAGPLAVRKGSAFPRGTVLQFKKSSAPLPDPAAGVSARRGGTAAPPSEAFTQALKATATSVELTVRGILQTGGSEDDQILAPLALVQKFAGLEGKFRRAEVSALTKPEDAFAHSDVTKLSPEEFDRWYCTPYVSSIAYQIQQAIPAAQAKAVYQVAETEGRILDRTGLLMALLAGAALVAAALAVASMMLATVHERRAEIGLFKSLGATETRIAAIFLLEAAAIGFIGGLVGYAAGSVLARQLAIVVFGSPARVHWILFAPSVALALLLTLVGSAIPLARGLQVSPALSLRNE